MKNGNVSHFCCRQTNMQAGKDVLHRFEKPITPISIAARMG